MMPSILKRLANHVPHHGFPELLPRMLALASLAVSSQMLTLSRFRHGRILLHLVAMLGDRCIRFHVAGVVRELPWVAEAPTLILQARTRLMSALVH
ncbi:hypothetical protein SBBP2_710001 [Burkholderiales bacterium]|jgi:hypothetical protein|nr:hypothetical protein SBBP2_710001 [Burkholderiales bacterium]